MDAFTSRGVVTQVDLSAFTTVQPEDRTGTTSFATDRFPGLELGDRVEITHGPGGYVVSGVTKLEKKR